MAGDGQPHLEWGDGMKGKWFLATFLSLVLIVFLASCAPLFVRKLATWTNVVEIVANDMTDAMKQIANANYPNYNNRVIFLWYDFNNPPTGFDDYEFSVTPADKNVYVNWEYVGNYESQSVSSIITAITNKLVDLSNPPVPKLTMYLDPDDPIGLTWSLYIGEGTSTKVSFFNYAFIELEKIPISGTNRLYKVTKVQFKDDWNNIDISALKGKILFEHKGYVFFKIKDDEVVDALVLIP